MPLPSLRRKSDATNDSKKDRNISDYHHQRTKAKLLIERVDVSVDAAVGWCNGMVTVGHALAKTLAQTKRDTGTLVDQGFEDCA